MQKYCVLNAPQAPSADPRLNNHSATALDAAILECKDKPNICSKLSARMPVVLPMQKNIVQLFSSDGVPRPIFTSLGLGLDGCRSQSQAYRLETLNVARIWLSKLSQFNESFLSIEFRETMKQ